MRAVKVVGPNHAEIQENSLTDTPVAGATLGGDFSGTIAGRGSAIKKSFNVGDRVLGWVVGNNIAGKENGGFAEYCVLDAELCVHVPDSVSDEEAASPPAGIATTGAGVFQKQGVPLPGEGDAGGETFLVYGGTSATGTIAIQMAKLAGFNVITTCSASNIDRVKALGATEAFDYKDPSCGEKIREYTKDSLKKIFDTISQGSSVNMCIAAASSSGAAVSTTLPWPEDRERKDEIEARMLFTLGIFGIPTGYGQNIIPANPEDYEYSKKLYAVAERLLHDGKLKVHPPKLCKPGLEGVFDAIEQGKTGKASGVKLIVKL